MVWFLFAWFLVVFRFEGVLVCALVWFLSPPPLGFGAIWSNCIREFSLIFCLQWLPNVTLYRAHLCLSWKDSTTTNNLLQRSLYAHLWNVFRNFSLLACFDFLLSKLWTAEYELVLFVPEQPSWLCPLQFRQEALNDLCKIIFSSVEKSWNMLVHQHQDKTVTEVL